MQKAIKIYGLLGLWLVSVGLMCRDYLADPYDPNLTGTAAYGHNGSGALSNMLLLSAVELTVLYLILRPWSYHYHSWCRSLLALMLLVPWTLLMIVTSMHGGGVVILHMMWLFVTSIILGVVTVISLVAWIWKRRSGSTNGRT